MKVIAFYWFTALLLVSCVDDVDNVAEIFPQQWDLVRMTGQSDHFTRTGRHLEWQEFYLLNPDGSFLKSRLQDGVKTSVTGTFAFQESEGETLLVLSFDEANDIIGSCSLLPEETLIMANNSLLIVTWQACDGPLLEYFRTK